MFPLLVSFVVSLIADAILTYTKRRRSNKGGKGFIVYYNNCCIKDITLFPLDALR
jgi:hypothetical protein